MNNLVDKLAGSLSDRASTVRVSDEQGSILIISLVFLLILSLGATTTMRTSTLELRMAGNEETRVATVELTQSIVDEVVGNPANMIVSQGVGFVNCTANVLNCNENSVTINTGLLPAVDADNAEVVVERLAPALTSAPRGISSSADAFFAARFEVDAVYDGTDDNKGKVGIVQGVLILVPRGTQTN
jgi:Tfp pilus assembly protein PilX